MDTEVRKFHKMVNEKGKVTVAEAAKFLKVSEDVVEDWARTLECANLVTLDYPLNPLESPTVKKIGFKPEKKVKKKAERGFLTKHVWRR